MDIDFTSLPLIVGWAAVLFGAYFMLYRKFIYSVIDPLFIWVLTTAFASVLITQVIPDVQDVLHFFGCQLSLWVGFLLVYKNNARPQSDGHDCVGSHNFYDQLLLRNVTYLLLCVYVVSNIIIGYNKGFALFSDSPTESKIENFQNGFGIFRKIGWSVGTFVSTALIYMCLDKSKKVDFFFLIIVTLFSSLEGSKSAFLQIAISAGIVFYHPSFSDKQALLKKLQYYIPLIFVATMGIFSVVLIKENDGIDQAFFAFIRRLLYSADSALYYYQPVNINYFEKYNFSDYVARLLNPILGFFRLQPYIEAPGNIMVDNLRPPNSMATVTVGPNAPFYIEGRIYFNFWVAFPYCVLVGYLYASLRRYYFSLKRTSAFHFVYMGSFLHLGGSIINDMNLAVTQSFDLFFFIIPLYIVVILLTKRKIRIWLSPRHLKYFRIN